MGRLPLDWEQQYSPGVSFKSPKLSFSTTHYFNLSCSLVYDEILAKQMSFPSGSAVLACNAIMCNCPHANKLNYMNMEYIVPA